MNKPVGHTIEFWKNFENTVFTYCRRGIVYFMSKKSFPIFIFIFWGRIFIRFFKAQYYTVLNVHAYCMSKK